VNRWAVVIETHNGFYAFDGVRPDTQRMRGYNIINAWYSSNTPVAVLNDLKAGCRKGVLKEL